MKHEEHAALEPTTLEERAREVGFNKGYAAGYAAAIEEAARHVEAHSCVSSCCDAQPSAAEAASLANCIRVFGNERRT